MHAYMHTGPHLCMAHLNIHTEDSATVPVTMAHGTDLIARVGPSQTAVDHCGEGFGAGTDRTGGAAGTESDGGFVSCQESDVRNGRIQWTAARVIVPVLFSTFNQLSLTDTVVRSYCKSSSLCQL